MENKTINPNYLIIIAGILGLKTSSATESSFLAFSLQEINNLDSFIEFVRDNKDGIQYATKTEKLDTLATKFKKLEASAREQDKLKSFTNFSRKLNEKFSLVKDELKALLEDMAFGSRVVNNKVVEVKNVSLRGFKLKGNKENLFTNKELIVLAHVGGHKKLIQLFEGQRLEGAIYAAIYEKWRPKKIYEIGGRVQKLLGRGDV